MEYLNTSLPQENHFLYCLFRDELPNLSTDKKVCRTMPDLLTPLQTISSVKNGIVTFEKSGPQTPNRVGNDAQDSGDSPLIEIAQDQKRKIVEVQQDTPTRSTSAFPENESSRKGHRRIDSTAFLKQTYLTRQPRNDLSGDVCEILKSQPSQEDLLAVLQYLQCGIDRKHDFSIRGPSAKASQITNALVNETVVDHWYRLKQVPMTQEDKKLKRYLVSCLSSVTGIGVLLAQVKKLAVKTAAGTENALKYDMISVLEQILSPPNIIYEFIQNTLNLTGKVAQRQVVWQEFMSLLAGSKILAVVAQAAGVGDFDGEGGKSNWLGDGPSYCKWLARSIAHAATTLLVKETEAWSMLAQMTRRGFSLGNRGQSKFVPFF